MLHEFIKDTQDRKFLRDQLLNVFLPARDASSTGLSGLFFHLARNPRVWTKLRSEAPKIDQPLTFDVLKSMKHLHCVFRESQVNLDLSNSTHCLSRSPPPNSCRYKAVAPTSTTAFSPAVPASQATNASTHIQGLVWRCDSATCKEIQTPGAQTPKTSAQSSS
ncbi:hypothetical protein N7G274_003915 [Stereocaulon virgatum]|uniref:Uncharacterized protein n=1 Tax=Stereocaulon virgatum TaxID=373712 RepID=A0ABR4AEW5_9LECA